MSNEINKSEILFLYETSYNIPNGDPFTGEQRYDEETKKILVSDVRIKRFIRTYLEDVKNLSIYVSENTGAGKTDSKNVLIWLAEHQPQGQDTTDIGEILKQQIDVRLFGGISTLKDDETSKIKVNGKACSNGHVQFTGPVQFALLNPSLNEVDLRMHQNTTHFTSNENNAQGSIGTTTLVPYSVMQIHGWINPKVAETTGLSEDDLKLMYEGLWYGTSGEGSSFSRSKVGQNSVLLVEIVYKASNKKIYGADRLISITPKGHKKGETIRSMDDYDFDFSKLIALQSDDRIAKVRYYTEIPEIEDKLEPKKNTKFEKMEL
jgi:CRISPR-associated protein Csh2